MERDQRSFCLSVLLLLSVAMLRLSLDTAHKHSWVSSQQTNGKKNT